MRWPQWCLPVHRDQIRSQTAGRQRRRRRLPPQRQGRRRGRVHRRPDQVAAGGTALDPEVVSQLLRASHHVDGLAALTQREREVIALMAEGRSNAGIATGLFISSGSVEKHVANIFTKLGLAPSEGDNRRVIAVLRYLQH